jgi:hypothetical protein
MPYYDLPKYLFNLTPPAAAERRSDREHTCARPAEAARNAFRLLAGLGKRGG